MIKNWTVSQHYDACIEMWNEIAENGFADKTDSSGIQQLKELDLFVEHECFACELYNNESDIETDNVGDNCIGCPFTFNRLYRHRTLYACCEKHSPYFRWQRSNSSFNRRKAAIDLAQLFINHYPADEV